MPDGKCNCERKPRRKGSLTQADGSVSRAIAELRSIHAILTEFLRRGRKAAHRDMVEVCPGIWIHKDFKDLSEAIKWLNAMIPNDRTQARGAHEQRQTDKRNPASPGVMGSEL